MDRELVGKAEEPLVFIDRDNVFTTSLDVAEKFKKRHANILRSVKKLTTDCSKSFSQLNYELSEYADSRGRMRSMYLMTVDGFSVLAMGLTGKEALKWKEKYIAAFRKLAEEAIERKQSHAEYLPGYHSLHQVVDKQYCIAEELGSSMKRQHAHSNINRMINKAFGIAPGTRHELSAKVMYPAIEWRGLLLARTPQLMAARQQPMQTGSLPHSRPRDQRSRTTCIQSSLGIFGSFCRYAHNGSTS